MGFKVVLTWPSYDMDAIFVLRKLKKRLPRGSVVLAPSSYRIKDLLPLVHDANVLFGMHFPRRAVEEAKKLRLIQANHTGISENFTFSDLRYLKRHKIMLGNTKSARGTGYMHESAFALILCFANNVMAANEAVHNSEWQQFAPLDGNRVTQVKGKTLGVIGLGGMGAGVARAGKAFGMKVMGIRKHTPDKSRRPDLVEDLQLDFVGTQSDLKKVLANSDFVVVACPLTDETEGMIGEPELKAMKKTAYLINIARAPVVDEKALKRALTERWIGGYGGNVWWHYPVGWGYYFPVPSREGINRMKNVIGIPDHAGFNEEGYEKYFEVSFENIEALARGDVPKTLVDLDLGY